MAGERQGSGDAERREIERLEDAAAPLFLGLARPARVAGLPLSYFLIWIVLAMILFVNTRSLWVVLPAGIAWVSLRALAEREPAYFEMLAVMLAKTPATRLRASGVDRYEA